MFTWEIFIDYIWKRCKLNIDKKYEKTLYNGMEKRWQWEAIKWQGSSFIQNQGVSFVG